MYAKYMKYLALTLPGGQTVTAPGGIPQGGITTVSTVIGNALTIMLIVAVILSLIYLILGGLQWISSGGDKSKVESARKRITFAIVGLIVCLCAFFLVNIIGFFFKTKLLGV